MESLIETWISWCEINTGTENQAGIQQFIDKLKVDFRSLNGHMSELTLPPYIKWDEGHFKEVMAGKALRITKKENAPKKILLSGHLDTVFEKESTFQKVKRHQNKLIGPGVADMKGGILVMLKSLELFENISESKDIGWTVLLTPDEEIGSLSSGNLILEEAKKHDAGLVFEPAYSDGALVSARKGSMNVVITSKGKKAHAGRDFFSGENAFLPLIAFAEKASKISSESKGASLNIASFNGGGLFNIVPDKASLSFNFRSFQDFEENKKSLLQIFEETKSNFNQKLEWHLIALRPPKPFDELQQSLFEKLEKAARSINLSLSYRTSGGVSDGNLLASAGLPTIDTLGVKGSNLHTFEEEADIPSLDERIALTLALLKEIASY